MARLATDHRGRPSAPLARPPWAGRRFAGALARWIARLPRRLAVAARISPAATGWRWTPSTNLAEAAAVIREIHPEAIVPAPLPRNVRAPQALPSERGWWGFSFRDVPQRRAAPTELAILRNARVVCAKDACGQFSPALIAADDRAVTLREIAFRPHHAAALRAGSGQAAPRAVWILERVYDNHAHWLTAHLPKLLLLRRLGLTAPVVLPQRRTPVIDACLRRLGFDVEAGPTIESGVFSAAELHVFSLDRLRPELARLTRDALAPPPAQRPWRRVYVTRTGAARGRRWLEEDQAWPALAARGFERVRLETLSLDDQIALMAQTALLVAPHGAGLADMLFCQPGAHVVELVDLGFPNPNFYALAAGLGLHYWLAPARGVGDGPPQRRDLTADPAQTLDIIARADAAATSLG